MFHDRQLIYFNSIKVQLEQLDFDKKGSIKSNFNSIKVQLELIVEATKDQTLPNFNSIKVQLEHSVEVQYQSSTNISIP